LVADGGQGQRLLSISLDDDEAWEIGLTCGGTLDVLLTRVVPSAESDPTVVAHRRALELLEAGEAAVIVTSLDATSETRTVPASEFAGGGPEPRVFLDRVAPPLTLVIVGAGQIAMTLTRLARELDMRTIVVDGRERYATSDRFPDADEIRVGMPSEIVAGVAPNKNVAVVLVAHDYKYELPVLRQVLRAPFGYIGLLGSRKRGAAVRDLLAAEGFTADELARVHTPIGVDLGGKRPEEVALSILAEVVAVRNGKLA
jgi:xanthine dehydrogenase accessory factor